MRVSGSPRRRLSLAAWLLAALLPLAGEALEPAFRLPAGGRPLAGPFVDARLAPAAAWILSEDRSLYALAESGSLVARIPLAGKPAPLLALDPFGRALVVLSGLPAAAGAAAAPASASGAEIQLLAYTRSGSEAYRAGLPGTPRFAPAFGADGRSFLVVGRLLLCLSPSGKRLWSRELPAEASAPPAVDGAGRPALGLANGAILVYSPYGEPLFELATGSPPTCLSPFGTAAYRDLPAAPAPAAAPAAAVGGAAPAPAAPFLGMPLLAAGLADGRVLLVGPRGERVAEVRSPEPIAALATDGALLLCLDARGRTFALSGSGALLWSAETGVRAGRLALFAERLVVLGKGAAVSLSLEGEVFREARFANAAAEGAVSPAGLLFSPGEDWVLAAYRFERPLGAAVAPRPPSYAAGEAASLESLLTAELKAFEPRVAEADRQLALLAGIEKSLDSATLGTEEPRAAATAAAIAKGAFDGEVAPALQRFRGNPLPRARAAWILGRIGSPENSGALLEVFAKDRDPAVRAAACEALAEIGLDPEGAIGAAFLAVVKGQGSSPSPSAGGPGVPLEEREALVLIAAVERLALRSGSPPSAEMVRAVLSLAAKPYGSEVRSRATRALGRIAGTFGSR